MTTKIYLKHTNAEDKQEISATKLAFAVLSINLDHQYNPDKLKTADAEEWAQLAASLQTMVTSGSAVYVGRFAVTNIEFSSAYGIAQQMQEMQQKAESGYQQAGESALPNTATTLGEKIRQDFPHDAIAQTLVLACIKEQANSLQQCEASVQASPQQ